MYHVNVCYENVLVKLICFVRLSFLISNPVRSLLCLMRNENCTPTYIGLSPVLYFCTCNIGSMYNETWLNFMVVYYNSSCTVNMFWLYIGHWHSPNFINQWHTIEFHATKSQLQEKQLFVQHCYFFKRFIYIYKIKVAKSVTTICKCKLILQENYNFY